MKPLTIKSRGVSAVVALVLSAGLVTAQTKITPPENKYTPAQDVQLGREAAAEVEQQLPVMRDDNVTEYADDIGDRLVAAIPAEFRHPEFRYTFQVVNVREINAFALPGGPMFVNRGMIEAAGTEGEVAGVMAHELSHVALRHGTAQASKATKYGIGQAAGQILGAIIGGGWGQVISQGTQFGLGAAFLRFGREYERQADFLGARIMAHAGYDPREMANMFRTIEKQGRSGGPEWLSSHPNPGNRYEYINREAQLLRVENPVRDTREFERVKAYLRRLPPAPTTEQATRQAGRRPTGTSGRTGRMPVGRVEPPSSRMRTYNEGNLFRVSVPDNWRELPANTAVTFAPDGAYGEYNGQNVFTHGVQLGLTRNETHDLRTATDELIESLASGNPSLSRPSRYGRVSIDGRQGLHTTLANVSDATGERETVDVFTTQTRDGNLFYTVAVAPRDEADNYRNVFNRVVGSIRLMD